jgi:MFS family permease
METIGISPTLYGMYNFIPVVGILVGSLASNHLGKTWSPKTSLKFGLSISTVGALLLMALLHLFPNALGLFAPMVIVYFGLSFIFGNSAALALQHTEDKGNASAVMSFINMGSAFIVVMTLGYVHTHSIMLLPLVFLGFMLLGAIWYSLLIKQNN